MNYFNDNLSTNSARLRKIAEYRVFIVWLPPNRHKFLRFANFAFKNTIYSRELVHNHNWWSFTFSSKLLAIKNAYAPARTSSNLNSNSTKEIFYFIRVYQVLLSQNAVVTSLFLTKLPFWNSILLKLKFPTKK